MIDAIPHFIFNWTTYFWMIPAWIIALTIVVKLSNGKVIVDDLRMILFCALINPVCNLLIIILVPTIILIATVAVLHEELWDKYKDKKIF